MSAQRIRDAIVEVLVSGEPKYCHPCSREAAAPKVARGDRSGRNASVLAANSVRTEAPLGDIRVHRRLVPEGVGCGGIDVGQAEGRVAQGDLRSHRPEKHRPAGRA